MIKPGPVLRHHKAPVTALSSAHQCRQGNWAEDLACRLVSCDETGSIAVWEATDANSYRVISTIEGEGVPCSSLAVRNNFVICGRLDGKIRIYGMVGATRSRHCCLMWHSALCNPYAACIGGAGCDVYELMRPALSCAGLARHSKACLAVQPPDSEPACYSATALCRVQVLLERCLNAALAAGDCD
jgi:hypothetical protein